MTTPPFTVEVLLTFAVNVTGCVVSDGLRFEEIEVEVEGMAFCVITKVQGGVDALPNVARALVPPTTLAA